MGNVSCRQVCRCKEMEEHLDIFEYKEGTNSNNNDNISIPNTFSETNSNFDTKIKLKKKNLKYIKFQKAFEKKLPLLGKYISNFEFESLIPEEARKYMTENILDISKYLSTNIKTYEIKPVEFIGGNVYKGNWNEKAEMEGYGQYFLKTDNVLAEGVWKNGFLIFARVFLPNGDLYEGPFQNSIFNGKGKLTTKNGEIYEGDFINGEKSGICTYLFPDGTIYNGQIKNGYFNGQGNMKWNNGIEYKGNFLKSTLCGYGILTNLDGEKYEGYFDKNYFNGGGKFIFDNDDVYEGNFENGKKIGRGIYIRNDGLIYEGEWFDDMPHGLGKIHYGDTVFKCSFRNGEIVELILTQGGGYNFQYNLFMDFKPENSFLYNNIFSHLIYENNNLIVSKYGPGCQPSFLED